ENLLFETHPDVQQVFMPFKEIELEDLKLSKELRAHALRVMAFVQKAVARLHEPEKWRNCYKISERNIILTELRRNMLTCCRLP
ncbi:hypothetical protein L9F63_025791, partial [Diploptera punctata]